MFLKHCDICMCVCTFLICISSLQSHWAGLSVRARSLIGKGHRVSGRALQSRNDWQRLSVHCLVWWGESSSVQWGALSKQSHSSKCGPWKAASASLRAWGNRHRLLPLLLLTCSHLPVNKFITWFSCILKVKGLRWVKSNFPRLSTHTVLYQL